MKAYERILNRGRYTSPLFKVQKPDGSTTVVCSDDFYDPTDPRLLYEVVEESIPFWLLAELQGEISARQHAWFREADDGELIRLSESEEKEFMASKPKRCY